MRVQSARGGPSPASTRPPQRSRDDRLAPVDTRFTTQRRFTPNSPVAPLPAWERIGAAVTVPVAFLAGVAIADLAATQSWPFWIAGGLLAWLLFGIAITAAWACLKGGGR